MGLELWGGGNEQRSKLSTACLTRCCLPLVQSPPGTVGRSQVLLCLKLSGLQTLSGNLLVEWLWRFVFRFTNVVVPCIIPKLSAGEMQNTCMKGSIE